MSSSSVLTIAITALLLAAATGSCRPAEASDRFDSAYFPTPIMTTDPRGVAVADLDGDGLADLVIPNTVGMSIVTAFGEGDGVFRQACVQPTGGSPDEVRLADLDGDQQLDALVAGIGTTSLELLPGRGDGTFGEPIGIGDAIHVRIIDIADMNEDGHLDILVMRKVGHLTVLYKNKGDGTFEPTSGVGALESANVSMLVDLNGDLDPDILLAAIEPNIISVRLGRPGPQFSNRSIMPTAGPVTGLAVGDLNADGRPDMIGSSYEGSLMFLGQGDGRFAPPLLDLRDSRATAVALADLDGDGLLDRLAAANQGNDLGVIRVSQGLGNGEFGQATELPSSPSTIMLKALDLDDDRASDLLAGGGGTIRTYPGQVDGRLGRLTTTFMSGVGSALLADIDRDGRGDMISRDPEAPGLLVRQSEGGRRFSTPKRINLPAGFNLFAVGEVTGDRHPDFIAAVTPANMRLGDILEIHAGDGAGGASFLRSMDLGQRLTLLETRDLDRDGSTDLLLAGLGAVGGSGGRIAVLGGNGRGAFRTVWQEAAPGGCRAMVIGDLDGDGRDDLAHGDGAALVVRLARDGANPFPVSQRIAILAGIQSIALGDVNGDTTPDLVIANYYGISVLLNGGHGLMGEPSPLISIVGSGSIRLHDLDHDGRPELIAAAPQMGAISVVELDEVGRAKSRLDHGAVPDPAIVEITDLDQDGHADIVGRDVSNGSLFVLWNANAESPSATPVFELASTREGEAVRVNWRVDAKRRCSTYELFREDSAGLRKMVNILPTVDQSNFVVLDVAAPAHETTYWVFETGADGATTWHGPTVAPPRDGATLGLGIIRPNPVRDVLSVSVTLPNAGHLTVNVLNVLGQQIVRLSDQYHAAGTHEFVWSGLSASGSRVAAGIYFVRAETGRSTISRKFVLAR